jgi:hypothetical protein
MSVGASICLLLSHAIGRQLVLDIVDKSLLGRNLFWIGVAFPSGQISNMPHVEVTGLFYGECVMILDAEQ